jgi:LysR family transcriptional regulator, nod-box dependent transcriptional activator
MRLDKFDLNLLVALNVLLEERSVTRAARRMNMTQSAMSAALRRLRESFKDELLVQHGNSMLPTPHALELGAEISPIVAQLRRVLAEGTAFDPAVSQREFKIAGSDYITTVVVAPLLEELEVTAPNVRVVISLPRNDIHELLSDGKVDFLLAPDQYVSRDHPADLLFEERHLVVGWEDNPVLEGSLTKENFLKCGHVIVQIGGNVTFVEAALREADLSRRVEVVAPSFTQVPWLLRGTNRLALMHERLAHHFMALLPLKVIEPPFELPLMREMIQYHTARTADPGVRWMRDRLIAVAGGNLSPGS